MKNGTLTSYITGFVLSIVATLVAFGLAHYHVASEHQFISHETLIPLLVLLAVVQLLVQLIFFLHVGRESKSNWNITVLAFACIVVVILVGGTLWIMSNLHHGQHELFEGTPSPETQIN